MVPSFTEKTTSIILEEFAPTKFTTSTVEMIRILWDCALTLICYIRLKALSDPPVYHAFLRAEKCSTVSKNNLVTSERQNMIAMGKLERQTSSL